MILLLTGCYPGEDFGVHVSMQVDEIETGLCSGNVVSSYLIHDGNPSISEVGICWEEYGSETLPTIQKKSKKSDMVSSPFSVLLSDLKESTYYAIRPYMRVDGFIVYGDVSRFSTPSNSQFLPNLGNLVLDKSELDKLVISSSVTSVPAEYPVTEVGVCYTNTSTSDLTIGMPGIKSVKGNLDNSKFTIDITGLNFSTYYYIRAYAKNKAGVKYGNTRTFRTAGDEYVPKLGEIEVEENKPTSLKIKCKVSEILKTDSIRAYFELTNTSYNYTTITINAIVKDGVMTATIDNLKPSTYYYIIAKAENKYGVGSSDKKQVTTTSTDGYQPIVDIPMITNVKVDGAHIESSIKIVDSKYKPMSGGFEYSTSEYMYSYSTKEGELVNDTLKLNLSGLNENTKYYIRAYVNTELGKIVTSKTDFTTAERIPTISELVVKNKTKTSVDISALVKPYDEYSSITEAGVQYTTNSTIYTYDTKANGSIVGDSVKVSLTNLKKGTSYVMRAYVVAGNKYYFGQTKKIITKNDNDYTPTINNVVATNITMTSLDLSSNYKLIDQTYKVTEAGFQYYKSSSASSVTNGRLYAGTIDNGQISLSVSDLIAGSTYQVRTYVKMDDGTIYYGNTEAINTKQASDYAPTFEETVASDLTMTSFKLTSGYKLLDETYKVTEAGFQYYKHTSPNYVANGKLYAGTINNGLFSLSVSDLTAGSTYQVRPYVKMDNNQTYYGNTVAVKTKGVADYAPIASLVTVSDTTMYSAKFKASLKEVSSDYPITEAGFQYYASTDSNYVKYGSLKSVTVIDKTIEMDLSSLTVDKMYQVRAYVKCSSGTYYGPVSSFKTLSKLDLPSVVCNDIADVNTTSFSIEADVKENHKSYPITEAGFLYIKSTSSSALTFDTNNAIRKPINIQNGKIKMTVSDLEKDATYLVRAYVMSGNEVTYNAKTIRVYTNMSNYKPSLGVLSLKKEDGKYFASCSISTSQVFPVTEAGFIYSTSTSNFDIDKCDGNIAAKVSASSISEEMPFTKPQTGSIRYYVRAYAKNANGIKYSSYEYITVSWND